MSNIIRNLDLIENAHCSVEATVSKPELPHPEAPVLDL